MGGHTESELTPKIGKVARRELANHGYKTYVDLTTASTSELLAFHGVGPRATRILTEELKAMNLSFAD